MRKLGLDIGGANLKAANSAGYADSRAFPLWRDPAGLAAALREMIHDAPPCDRLAVTMTGELADCFATKADGVRHIIGAVVEAAEQRPVYIYMVDGRLVRPALALEQPLLAAASNWHALATFAGRFTERRPALLIDIGSTTSDLIPMIDGLPRTQGNNDPERLASGELVYTGVRRSPLCGLVETLPWGERTCRVAQEWFATAADVYLLLGKLPEDAARTDTADGRPATRAAAHARLARMICADTSMFILDDARRAAEQIVNSQLKQLVAALTQVMQRMPEPPQLAIISGEGEFLARQLCKLAIPEARVVPLSAVVNENASRAAPAYAVAWLAEEWL